MGTEPTAEGGKPWENRTRVSLFLPADDFNDLRAVREVIGHLMQQRNCAPCPVTGFTITDFQDSPFQGLWWSEVQKNWALEKIAFLIIDYGKETNDADLADALRKLKEVAEASYRRVGKPQEAIWLTGEPVKRLL